MVSAIRPSQRSVLLATWAARFCGMVTAVVAGITFVPVLSWRWMVGKIARSSYADAPDWVPHLVLAADQFIVRRSLPTVRRLTTPQSADGAATASRGGRLRSLALDPSTSDAPSASGQAIRHTSGVMAATNASATPPTTKVRFEVG